MLNREKRSCSVFLAVLLTLVLISSEFQWIAYAAEEKSTVKYGEVWSAPNTVKIQQNVTQYATKGDVSLSYDAVRNEFENAQLIITATKDISEFELETADLVKGSTIFSKDNFSVYVQKYTSVSDRYGTLKMPDALLPMDAAGQYGENVISANMNGALWVTVYIPKRTEAGTYEGTFQLSLNGSEGEEVVDIPVSVQVYDYTLPDEPTTKSLFSWRYDEVAVGELDGSIQMMETYYEFYQKYRISLESLPIETLSGSEYVETIEQYWDRMSTYTLLESPGFSGALYNSEEAAVEQILAIAKASKTECNLFEKAMLYFIDEPDIRDKQVRETVITKLNLATNVLQSCVEIIEMDETDKYANFKSIQSWREWIIDIPKIIPLTENTVEWLLENEDTEEAKQLLEAMNCICVKFADDTTMQRILEMAEKNTMQLWWYTCNYPIAPYGNLDIGDESLLRARSFSWYQSKYDVQGLLYWSATGYTGAGDAEFLDLYNNAKRYYTDPLAPAGDGFLTYPGAAYGVYGPIPSIRLMSLRDGLEEADLLNIVEREIGESSFSEFATEFYNTLGEDTSNLYQDLEKGLDFQTLRQQLLNKVATFEDASVNDAESNEMIKNVVTAPYSSVEVGKPEEENTELLLSFDSYKEITGAGLKVGNQFGETKVNNDTQFISEGSGSWFVKPQGDYGKKDEYPYFRMRCLNVPRETSFRKCDFSTYDKVLLDIYNASSEEVQIAWSFLVQNVFGSYTNSEKCVYTLKPHAWTTCEYDLTGQEYNAALCLTTVKYMNVTFLTKKDSKEAVTSELYLDNLRGHLLDEERVRNEYNDNFNKLISFENPTERYLFSDDGTGNNAMTLSRVSYSDCDIEPRNETFGEYVLKSEVKGATWPSFTLYYNEQRVTGDIVSFMLYVSAEKEHTENDYYYVQCNNGNVSVGQCALNKWVYVEIELKEDAQSSWIFLNFDNGTGSSKYKKVPLNIYMDNFMICDTPIGNFAEGITMENPAERHMVQNVSMVEYSDSTIGVQEPAYGSYGISRSATGNVWPHIILNYDKTYSEGSYLTCMLYVEVDESVVATLDESYFGIDSWYATCKNEKVTTFNTWIKATFVLGSKSTDSLDFFLNFDNGNEKSKFGDVPVTIYVDNILISDEEKSDNYYVDISGYRTGEYTAPKVDDKQVFAGWYEDEAFTQPVNPEVKSGGAYAKFVDADVLSVKCQFSADTTIESEYTNLRIVTTVDSLQYSAVGFFVQANEKTVMRTAKTVYETIKGYVNGEGIIYQPIVFSEMSKYFMAYKITEIPRDFFSQEFIITPLWMTLDGTTVTGATKKITIEEILPNLEKGLTFENTYEENLVKGYNLTLVNYEETTIGHQTEEYGTYGMSREVTGVKAAWPSVTVTYDKTYSAGSYLTFMMYVEVDEELAEGKWYGVDSHGNLQLTGDITTFNTWVKGTIQLNNDSSSTSFFFNFDNDGSGTNVFGDNTIKVYLDNIRVEAKSIL